MKTTDPVCKTTVESSDTKAVSEYKGGHIISVLDPAKKDLIKSRISIWMKKKA